MAMIGRVKATVLPEGKEQEELVGEEGREEGEQEPVRRGETGNPGHPEMESMGSQQDKVAEAEGEEGELLEGEGGHQLA